MIKPNALFNADCIELFQRMESDSIDLVYLDPPLSPSTGALDTSSHPGQDYSWHQHMQFIANVCQHAHRVLKSAGVIFFHAQPLSTFSIRLILNQVFGEKLFQNEIVWNERHQLASKDKRGTQHDSILQYGKSSKSTDNAVFRPLSRAETRSRFPKSDARGAFALADLTVTLSRDGLQFEWDGVIPPKGRSWRFNLGKLRELEQEGLIYRNRGERIPKLKVFLDEHKGIDIGTIWTDMPRLSPAAKENVGYSTQKPLGLLERILFKGSNEGETVLDPFCGSGTTVVAAERHRRTWIACDTSEDAIAITRRRLSREFGKAPTAQFFLGDTAALERIAIKPTRFQRVAVRVEEFGSVPPLDFVLNRQVAIEETRHFEFKEVRTPTGAVDSIVNASDEYAVAFLNSEGGRIYWGIRDKDRVVVGVQLSFQDRDNLRRKVRSKLNEIEPKLDPAKYRIEIHKVRDDHGYPVPDTWVVELVVPASGSTEPYYTAGGEAWVKVDGAKQKLKGIALTDFIKQRLTKAL